MMKNKFLLKTLMAVLLGAFALTAVPTTSFAGHDEAKRRVSSCGSCGHGVYAYRRAVGYDHCRRPVYRWVTAHHNCGRSRHSSHGQGYDRHRSGHHYSVSPHDIARSVLHGILSR